MKSERVKLNSSEFINKIIQDADTGYCFVPLIGSGLSSPSGIIMGSEFTNYLAFTMYLVLEDPANRSKTYGEGKQGRWNLVTRGWPPFPSTDEVEQAKKWVKTQFQKLCERLELDINYDDMRDSGGSTVKSITPKGGGGTADFRSTLTYPRIPTILLRSGSAEQIDDYSRKLIDLLARKMAVEQYAASFAIDELVPDSTRSYHNRIIEMGIRALHDWRETLVFLSMIGIDPRDSNRLVRKNRDSSVIDAFNLTITRDKQPNLGHKIIAHLASPLRIQSILTTNFDTLMEDAYRALSLSLRVLPVSARGRLPEARTVASEDCLVKLHGEAQDTRADLTLDEEPGDEDKATFAAYLTQGAGHLCPELGRGGSDEMLPAKRLLIVGYSGSDYRCVQMIRHWLETAREAVVYWICFSENDVQTVRSLFGDSIYSGQIRITQSSRPDLLLYELYQRLVLSLPPGGLTYEFSHIVPPRRLKQYDFHEDQVRNALECGLETGHPLEAARVLLGDSGTNIDAQRLTRDALVMHLKEKIIEASNRQLQFYHPNGDGFSVDEQDDPYVRYAQWLPLYRDYGASRLNREENNATYDFLKARPIVMNAAGGVVRAAAIAFEKLGGQAKKIFWIETVDYMDADGLLRDFLRGLALRFGAFQSQHVTLHPLAKPLVEEYQLIYKSLKKTKPSEQDARNIWSTIAENIAAYIRDILIDYRADAKSILVLFYGRDGYGGSSGLIQSDWLANSLNFPAFHCVIEALARANIQVIYFPLTRNRAEAKSKAITAWEVETTVEDQEFERINEEFKKWQNQLFLDPSSHSSENPISNDKVNLRRQWVHDPFLEENSLDVTTASLSSYPTIIQRVLTPFFTTDDIGQYKLRPRLEQFNNEKRLSFLYAITLFRHSRNPNALCSEATFPCPFRFSANFVDNDFVRSEESSDWISQMREARVFFDKPGGSIWMHRDIRESIQAILESVPLGLPDVKSRRNMHFGEMRSRLHFWIGDWYLKAFCSSGHLTPVVEALYHRIMAALYAPLAKPKKEIAITSESGNSKNRDSDSNIRNYRVAIFESAVLECCKTVLLSWHWLHLWQACTFDASWVTDSHRKEINDKLKIAINRLLLDVGVEQERSTLELRLTNAVMQLDELLGSLAQHLTIAGGGELKDTTPAIDPHSSPLLSIPSSNAPHRNQFIDSISISRTQFRPVDHSLNVINKEKTEFYRILSRNFSENMLLPKSESSSESGLNMWDRMVALSDPKLTIRAREKFVEDVSILKAKWKEQRASDVHSLHQMIWLLGETAYVVLRRAKLMFHATKAIDFQAWLSASTACNLGIDLCKHLPPSMLDFEIQAKVKLHAIYSVCLANLGRSFEASRHLNEAQAILSKSRLHNKSDYAILNLRRAEVRMTECFWIRPFLSFNPKNPNDNRSSDKSVMTSETFVVVDETERLLGTNTFFVPDGFGASTWSIDSLKHYLNTECDKSTFVVPARVGECIRKAFAKKGEWAPKAKENLIRLYFATLDEAVALLDQAEKQLSGHSQTSLWWSRLHTLRLRCYGMLNVTSNAQDSEQLEILRRLESCSLVSRKHDADFGIYSCFSKAYRISRHDQFRKFRTLKYFLDANEWHYRRQASLSLSSMSTIQDPQVRTLTVLDDSMKLAKQAFSELWELVLKDGGKLLQAKAKRDLSNWRVLVEEHPFLAAIINLAEEFNFKEYTQLSPKVL